MLWPSRTEHIPWERLCHLLAAPAAVCAHFAYAQRFVHSTPAYHLAQYIRYTNVYLLRHLQKVAKFVENPLKIDEI